MADPRFTGAGVALVTPFDENGVNERVLRELVRFHHREGTDALVVCGSTGEAATMSPEEQRRAIEIVVDENAGKLPVIAGCGGSDTARVAELARHPNIAGLKDSSGDMKRFAEFVDACGEHCSPLVGNGALFYTALELGAAGGIIALGLLAPAECVAIYRHYSAGESRSAGEIQERIAPVHKEIVAQYGAPGVKVALELLGYDGGPPRSPLVGLSEKQRRHVAQVMQEAGLLG